MNASPRYRAALPRDILGIVELVNGFAAERVMLPRTPESVELALDDFIVAVDGRGAVIACGALKEYSPSLAEVASLAVSRRVHARGLGRGIMERLELLARRRGIAELFALTLTPGFFERAGYVPVERALYPEKMKRDCVSCARRFGCAEVCVRRLLDAAALAA